MKKVLISLVILVSVIAISCVTPKVKENATILNDSIALVESGTKTCTTADSIACAKTGVKACVTVGTKTDTLKEVK